VKISNAWVAGVLCTGVLGLSVLGCGSTTKNVGFDEKDSSAAGPGSDNGTGSSSSGGATGGPGTFGVPSGSAGGSASGGTAATTTPTPQNIDDCQAGATLTSAQQQALFGGGTAGNLRFLYPYDATLFPRGLLPPTLMWDQGPADLIYVHIKSSLFEYKGCVVPTADGQFELPADVWSAAEASTKGGNDPFAVELSVLKGTVARGPIRETIFIAAATLKGTIYYNSYESKLVSLVGASSGTSATSVNIPGLDGGFGAGSGAVLRIRPGQKAEVFLGDHECTGCHAVSANGTRMVADAIIGSGGDTYALTPNVTTEPKALVKGAKGPTFVGLYPDGSLYVANGHPDGMGPAYAIIAGLAKAALFETDTGNEVADSGVPSGAMCPTFSPDGTQLVFNDFAISNGHGLALMAFDKSSRTATGYKKIFEETDTASSPGGHSFCPTRRRWSLRWAGLPSSRATARASAAASSAQRGRRRAMSMFSISLPART
jgi:hypothetical protein